MQQIATSERLDTPRPKLVFPNTTGGYISHNNFRKRYTKLLVQQAHLKEISTHSLRHIGASLVLSKGSPITTVSQMLGHANPAITMSIYAHAIPDSQQAVVETMESIMTIKK